LHRTRRGAMVEAMPKLAWLLALAACGSGAHGESTNPPRAAHPGGMPHRFDHAETWAKDFDAPSRDAWQQPDRVLAALELGPKMVIADIGAGTGYFAVRLARAVPDGQVIATDIEPDMVRYLGERAHREQLPNIRTVLATADDPQLPPASVDRILVVDVWHHLADRTRYATGLARALRPGGKIFVVDFTQEANHGPPKHMRLAPAAIVADLQSAGLTAAVDPTQLPDQYIVSGSR